MDLYYRSCSHLGFYAEGVITTVFLDDILDNFSNTTTVEEVVQTNTTTYYCTAQSGVIVRQEPSSKSAQLGGLQYNQEVEVYEIVDGYARINYYGNDGWVSSKYIAVDEGEVFLKENAKRKGVKTLPSGLQYEVIKKGKGTKPQADSVVWCHYTLSLPDGTIVDSSRSSEAPVSLNLSSVIIGFSEGLQQMKEGARYKLYIPADMAYGTHSVADIPGRSVLIYDVELISVLD